MHYFYGFGNYNILDLLFYVFEVIKIDYEQLLNELTKIKKEIKELKEAIIILWNNEKSIEAQKLMEKMKR